MKLTMGMKAHYICDVCGEEIATVDIRQQKKATAHDWHIGFLVVKTQDGKAIGKRADFCPGCWKEYQKVQLEATEKLMGKND